MTSRHARSLVPLAAGTVVARHDHRGLSNPPRVTYPIAMPRPPEVEVTRHDGLYGGWVNYALGLGGAADVARQTTYQSSMPLPRHVIDALLRFNGLASNIAEREAYDCTREGFTLGADPAAERLRVKACASISGRSETDNEDNSNDGLLTLIARARTYARSYGGAAIIVLVEDGLEPSQPIVPTAIRKIQGARVVTRWELSPLTYDRRRDSHRIGMPETYQVTIGGVQTITVHYTRVILFDGVDLPDHIRQQNNGWGGSIFDRLWDALAGYQVSMSMLPKMLGKMSQGVYTMDTLEDGVAAGLKDQIIARIEGQQAAMNAMGDMVLSPKEKYEILSRSVSGLQDIVGPLQLDVVANGDGMPKVIMFSETPGGIRSGENPEYTAWLDNCSGRQPKFYTGPTKRLLRLIALAKEGPCGGVVPPMDFEWNPLYQLSQDEQDKSDLSRAQRREIDSRGAVTAAEVRTDPDLKRLYPGFDPTAIPSTPGVEPEGEEFLTDEEEMDAPTVIADASMIPAGEPLVGIRRAARDLGRSVGSIMRDARAGTFPIWRDGGRWKVAMSLVREATTPHVFPALAAAE